MFSRYKAGMVPSPSGYLRSTVHLSNPVRDTELDLPLSTISDKLICSAVLCIVGISLSRCTFSTQSEVRLSIGEFADGAGKLLSVLFGSGCLRCLLNANLEVEEGVDDWCIFFNDSSRPAII